MNRFIPSFVPLSPAQIRHLKALDNVKTDQELENEIKRFEAETAQLKHEDSEPTFQTDAARVAYRVAEARIKGLMGKPEPKLVLSDLRALTKIPPLISHLTSLTQLYLHDTSVSDISALGGLTSLTLLSIDRTSVSEISALGGLTSLTTLSLAGTSVTDITPVKHIKGLKVIQT